MNEHGLFCCSGENSGFWPEAADKVAGFCRGCFKWFRVLTLGFCVTCLHVEPHPLELGEPTITLGPNIPAASGARFNPHTPSNNSWHANRY